MKNKVPRHNAVTTISSFVFLLMIGIGIVTALDLYGLARPTQASAVLNTNGSKTLTSFAGQAIIPNRPLTLQQVISNLAKMSLSIGDGSASEHITRTQISWTSLMQNLVQRVQPKRRLIIGWALDEGGNTLSDVLTTSPGLTVLAPKWLHVDGLNGAVAGTIEPSVVRQAKKMHIQVWAVIDNGFNGPFSHKILQYKDQQSDLINRIVTIARKTGINGINLDFEGLLPEDRWNYSQFVATLASKLHHYGIELSVDLPPDLVEGDNAGPYNHHAIAHYADQVILMGYDEHWGGDPTPGPTAALPWVEAGVKDMLTTGVPSSKLVLGVPFYTQDWVISSSGTTVDSQALSLVQMQRVLTTHRVAAVWNKALGLPVAHYTINHTQHVVWLEDDRSLLLSLQLISHDNLAGVAAWYLGLEQPSTWHSLVLATDSSVS